MLQYASDTKFDQWRDQGLSVTFGDILIRPRLSTRVARSGISLKTRFSTHIDLNIPLVAAAMDTVTESTMAIKMALMGGIGVIHRNMTHEAQLMQVRATKRFRQGRNDNPACMKETDTVAQWLEIRAQKGYTFMGCLIVDNNGKLMGVISRDAIEVWGKPHTQLGLLMTPVDKLLVREAGLSPEDARVLMEKHQVKSLPLVDADGRPVSLYSYKDQTNASESPWQPALDGQGRLRVAAAVNVHPSDRDHILALVEAGCDAIVIDTAHGHNEDMAEQVEWIRLNAAIDIVAGNISTEEAADFLREQEVHSAKVGQGSGSICTTRDVTGMGVMQADAVHQCARVFRGSGIGCGSDGGTRKPGDLAKAIACGADYIMVGNLLAGTDETPGEIIIYRGRSYKKYRGMGSAAAMNTGQSLRYDQQNDSPQRKHVPEGVSGLVPYKGSVESVVRQYMDSLRGALGYFGCSTIPELQRTAQIIRMTREGQEESTVHDVEITADATFVD